MISKCKALAIVMFLALLGGCSTLDKAWESTMGTSQEPQTPTAAGENQVTTDEAQDQTLSAPSAEEQAELEKQRAQSLLVDATDRFAQTKSSMSQSAVILLNKALSLFKSQQYEAALSTINEAKAKASPLNSSAYVLEGDIYLALEKTEQAITSFDKALSLNKNNYKAANRRAQQHRQLGEFSQALALYTQAIEAYPGHAASYRNRGILQDLYMQRKAQALQDYQRYEMLLDYQQSQLEDNEHQPMNQALSNIRPSLTPAQLKKELRRVKGWIVDLERQIPQQNAAATMHTMQNAGGQ